MKIRTYAGERAVGEARVGPPFDLLGRKAAGPLALEEEDGFGEGVSVVLSGFNDLKLAAADEEREIDEEEDQEWRFGKRHNYCT